MTAPVPVWFTPRAPDRLRWLNAGGAVRYGSFADLAAELGERECVMLLDGVAVCLFNASIPTTDLRTARLAAPNAIEELLASAQDELQFATVALGHGEWWTAATATSVIAALRERLDAQGLTAALVTAEYCAVPYAEHTWTITLDDHEACLRLSSSSGLKVPITSLSVVVPLLRRQFPHTTRVNVHAARTPPAWPSAAFQGLIVEWRPALTADDITRALASAPRLALFDASRSRLRQTQVRRAWIVAGVCALAVLLLHPLLLRSQNVALTERAAALVRANHALVTASFPDVTRIVNARVQADQALAARVQRAGDVPRFIDLLAHIDRVRAAGLPAATRIANLNYTAGVVELALETISIDAVEAARAAFEAAGLSAETLAAEAASGKIIARLRITAAS